jgi:SAM-dependent methyltransferase
VPSLLQRAGERARGERLDLELRLGDAEHLPFADGAFDVCLSTFGVLFTPNHELAARELVRVCRPGGRIALAAWTPEGFIGQLFAAIRPYAPEPPPGKSPLLWGTVPHVLELFGARAQLVRSRKNEFVFRYRSADHFIDAFRSFYGPVHQLFEALAPERRSALVEDLRGLLQRFDRGSGKGLVVPGEYLEVVVERPQ